MKKTELAGQLAEYLPTLSHNLLMRCVNTITSTMASAIAQGQRIEIRGFGCLAMKKQAPRLARNPKTGETFTTTGGCKVHFKPSWELIQRLN